MTIFNWLRRLWTRRRRRRERSRSDAAMSCLLYLQEHLASKLPPGADHGIDLLGMNVPGLFGLADCLEEHRVPGSDWVSRVIVLGVVATREDVCLSWLERRPTMFQVGDDWPRKCELVGVQVTA